MDSASANNVIGGIVPGSRNVISGNFERGLVISGAGSNNNSIVGNFIGTNASGTGSVPNGTDGIWVISGPKFNRIGTNGDGVDDAAERNIISGNTRNGVQFEGAGTSDNIVAGNYIGTTVSGTALLGNGLHGVIIFGTASNNRIGTDGSNDAFNANEANIISGSGQYGIRIRDVGTNGTVIAGNLIGTDITGSLDFGNGLDGIILTGGTSFNRIGSNGDGTHDALERNVISGNNRHGILVDGNGTSFNSIAGNYIGSDVSGTQDLGNVGHGVLVQAGAKDNRIGTDGSNDAFNASERNVIAGNDLWAQVAIYGFGVDRNVFAETMLVYRHQVTQPYEPSVMRLPLAVAQQIRVWERMATVSGILKSGMCLLERIGATGRRPRNCPNCLCGKLCGTECQR